MENGLYIGLSRQMVLRTSMDLVANNIANANTPGYRAQQPLFKEYISDPKGGRDPISMVTDYGQYDITAPGTVQVTGNDLDVALTGPGFMGINTPAGDVQYTRAGNFALNNNREIVTPVGMTVAAEDGGAIQIPAGAKDVRIDKEGRVSTDQGEVGRLMIREFDNPQSLTPQGHGLYKTAEAGNTAENTVVSQGQIEGSNVEPVREMTHMISISREYQTLQRMLQNDHERQRTAIQRLGRPAGS